MDIEENGRSAMIPFGLLEFDLQGSFEQGAWRKGRLVVYT